MTIFRTTALMSAIALVSGIADAEAPSDATVLEFANDDILFVADAATGSILAYDLPDIERARKTDEAYNLLDVDRSVSLAVGAAPGTLVYKDLAVHPVSRDAYLSVSYEQDGVPRSSVVVVDRTGQALEVDLANTPVTQYVLDNQADKDVSFWRDIPAQKLSVTDIDYVNGELFVSGLSTGEFASTLRRIQYPFEGPSTSTSIEMYHAAHAQTETRAPIRAMTVVDLEGVPTIVAAYVCTPLVTVPVDELQDGAHVAGKTIAELGYGNTPLDVISFSAPDMAGELGQYVLVVNREMAADLITFDALSEASSGDGISSPVPYLGATAGVQTITIPMAGVMHAADQDNQFILTLRRDIDTGKSELVSFRKGAFFRLSDFISEYNFPDYQYADNEFAQGTRMFQNMLKTDEGFPGEIR